MNPFELRVKLKQHTPMIHFESDVPGAIIRGSELKPKLDRFLLKKYKGEQLKKYLLDSDIKEGGLDYKVKFQSEEHSEIDNISSGYPMFFGNLGEQEQSIKFIYYKRPIEMIITSMHTDLLGKIKSVLSDFFMHHNFGMRQTKGFGSFYIDTEDKLYKNQHLKYYYSFSISPDKALNWKKQAKEIFKGLDKKYKNIRGNWLEEYIGKLNIKWDRDVIRKVISGENFDIEKIEGQYLVKDLLGFAMEENWMSYDATIKKVHKPKEKDEIKRYASPVFFKIIVDGKKVYISFEVLNENKEVLGQEFGILLGEEEKLSLKTPTEFNMNEYMAFVSEKINKPKGNKKNEVYRSNNRTNSTDNRRSKKN